MFVRTSCATRRGKTYSYTQLVESFRRESDGMPQHRVLANLGKLTALEVENLKASLEASRKGRRVVVAPSRASVKAGDKPGANLRYLDLAVARELWRAWGLGKTLDELLPVGEAEVAAGLVIESLVMQRLVAPASKLSAVTWFPNTALPELTGIRLSQFNNTRLHRTLSDLDSVTPALMDKLPPCYRKRDGAFASLFMDVTDTWFEGHGCPKAARAKTKEGLIKRKIGIVLLCNEHGFPLRWEVVNGKCADGPAMLAMLDTVAGLDWLGEAPLVLDRAMGHSVQIHAMVASKLRFLTALTRPEFDSYAPSLPYQKLADLCCDDSASASSVSLEAQRRVAAAGMQKVADDLFVMDFGVFQPTEAPEQQAQDASPSDEKSQDPNAHALRLAHQARKAMQSGYSKAAAAKSVNISKPMLFKYQRLLKLPEELQQKVLDGAVAARSLASLIRVAEITEPTQQHNAFQELMSTTSLPGARFRKQKGVVSKKDTSTSCAAPHKAHKVRVVGYFNPARFVEQRRNAAERLRCIAQAVTELNVKLASPRSKRTPSETLSAVDRLLRKEQLLNAFRVAINQQEEKDGSERHQVTVELVDADWQRRRRYDGFSVLVGHAQLKQPAEELCRLYRAKDVVEKDFQTIKGIVKLRPVRHRTDPKVNAHVTLCILALLIERTLRKRLAGRYSAKHALEILEPCRLNCYPTQGGKTVYTTTALNEEQRAILKLLRLQHLADDNSVIESVTPVVRVS
jgi:hypothetical protein